MTAEVVALTEELRITTEMLGKDIARLDEADRRANRHRVWTGVLALCVMANALMFGLFYKDDQNDDTASCLRSNATRSDIREAILETVRTVAAGRDTTADELEVALDQIDQSLRRRLPDRNC